MSEIKVERTLTGYSFIWQEELITAQVSRVRSHSDGRLTGDLQWVLGRTKKRTPSSQFNFTSATTRKQLVTQFNEKYPEWQWLGILDELCIRLQEVARLGEPVQELFTSDDIRPPEFLLDPLLLKGLPTIIFGEKGVTKSYLSLVFYLCLTLPWSDNPLGLTVPTRSVKTVILDWELPGSVAQWNLKKLVEGMDLGALPLYHRRCSAPLADDIEQVQRYIEELNCEVVIIDSLGRAAGGELSRDTENATRFFNALDKLNVSSLILAQTSKDTQSKRKSVYGSVYFTYYARMIFELCKVESIGEDEASVALFHRYSNLSKIHPPMGFNFRFNGNYVKIGSQPVSYNEFVEKVSRQLQILELLRDGALETKEIMERLEMSRSSADVTLKKLKDKQKIVKLIDNRWGLAVAKEIF